MKSKFITVMAVFDEETQKEMHGMQAQFIERFGAGTQTMGIPFHISLGSYPVEDTDAVAQRVISAAGRLSPFDVEFDGMGDFGGKVIFMQPVVNDSLLELHELFDSNYADGFDWHAHATLFCCGEGQTADAADCGFACAERLQKASIVGIELGEFFPAKKIIYAPLEGE